MSAPLAPRLFSGIWFSFLGNASAVAAALLLTPYLVHRLGAEGYALYAFVGTLQGYLILLNLGAGVGVQRYAGHLRRHPGRLCALLWKALKFQALMGLAGALAFALGRHWFAASFFNIHEHPLAVVAGVLFWAAATVPFTFLINFAVNAIYGGERFAAYNAILALQSILVQLAGVAVVAGGYGVLEVAQAICAVHAGIAAWAMLLVRGELSKRAEPSAGDWSEFKVFSLKNFVSQLLWQLTSQGDRLFLLRFLPLWQLGFYSIGAAVAQKLNVFFGAVAVAAFPIMTDLQARGEEERFRRFYLKASELTLFYVLPIAILVYFVAPQFMGLWLGQEFGNKVLLPFRFLVIANVGYHGALLPQSVALSRGAPGLNARVYGAKLAVLLVLWAFLVLALGLGSKGVAMGLALAEWGVTLPYLAIVHRRFMGISPRDFWVESVWRPLIPAAALTALVWPTHGLITGWLPLVGYCALAYGLSLVLTYWILDEPARALLHDWLKAKFGRGKAQWRPA